MSVGAGICYHLKGYRHYLPILSTTLKSHVVDLTVSHTLTQVFANKSNSAAIPEAKYTFPLYESSAVTGFSALVGEKTIRGVVKEKSQAKAIYEQAKSAGKVAALFDQNTPDVFTTSVGNIPAASFVVVVVKYVHELKQDIEVDGIKLVIPTTIAPKYGTPPSDTDYRTSLGYSPAWRRCWQRFSQGVPDIGDAEGEGVSILVTATTSGPIRGIQSPTHPIAVTLGSHSAADQSEFNPKKAQATLAVNSSSLTNLDKDFTLLINATDIGNPRAFLAPHPTLQDTSTLVVTLVPRFVLPPQHHEIVFVVDRSGSMGDKIGTVRSALNVFLASLPVGSYFNICSFGSSHSFLWPNSRKYSAQNLNAAKAHVGSMQADLGGTEMVRPISEVIKHRRKDMKTEVLLLTDGDIWDTQNLLDLISRSSKDGSIRFFSLGVGDSVSHALVEGISRAGNGYSQTVSGNANLQKKVMRMLKAALTPHVNDWCIDWDGADPADKRAEFPPSASSSQVVKPTVSLFDPTVDPDNTPAPTGDGLPEVSRPKIIQAPAAVPPLFPYSRVIVYLIISSADKPTSVSLCGSAHDSNANAVHPLKLEIPVQQLSSPGTCLGLYRLAGRKLLQDLEEGRATYLKGLFDPKSQPTKHASLIEREGTRIGVEFGLASKWTSFVAVAADGGEELAEPSGVPGSDDTEFASPPGKKRKAKAMRMRSRSPLREYCISVEDYYHQIPFSESFDHGPLDLEPFPQVDSGIAPTGLHLHPPQAQMQRQSYMMAPALGRDSGVRRKSRIITPPATQPRRRSRAKEAPPAIPPPPEGVAVVAVLSKLQEFSGLFQLRPDLVAALGAPAEAIMGQLAGSVDGHLLATMIVVKILQKNFASEMEEWELMVEKGLLAATAQFGAQEVERVGAAIDGLLV